MRACVIYDTRFGNTEKIARAIQSGIGEGGVQTDCLNWKDVEVDSLKEYDLLCIGAPTEAFSASKPIKDFIAKLDGAGLSGKYGFAFDTKVGSRISGSAAKFIEKALKGLGLRLLAPHESAVVVSPIRKDRAEATVLKAGEELRFQQVGKQVGAALLESAKAVRP